MTTNKSDESIHTLVGVDGQNEFRTPIHQGSTPTVNLILDLLHLAIGLLFPRWASYQGIDTFVHLWSPLAFDLMAVTRAALIENYAERARDRHYCGPNYGFPDGDARQQALYESRRNDNLEDPMSYLNEYDGIPASNDAARITLVNRWVATEARPFFAELRERRPIFQTPAHTLVTRYRDVISVLSRDDIFTVRPLALKMDPAVGPVMQARDRQPLNWRHKSIMRTMIPMEDVPKIRHMVASIVSPILEKATLTGRLEAVNELGRAVPYRLCGDYFGFPGPDRSTMYRWSKATQRDFFKTLQCDAKIHQEAVQAGQEMASYLKDLIAQRKSEDEANCKNERTDVVRRLLQTCLPPGLGLDSAEMISNISILLVGSLETTSQAIVQILEQILLRPEVLAAALQAVDGSNLDAFDAIVWEALRFNPNGPLLPRLTSAPAELGSGTPYMTHINAGTLVFACTASAMWDEREVPNPDAFVPGRPSHHYLHFGYKAHECLGIHVAEVMVSETVRQVLLTKNVHLLEGADGKIDFHGGPFPERFVLGFGASKT